MSRGTKLFVTAALVVALAFGVLAAVAVVSWPRVGVGPDDRALARFSVPRFGGRVEAVRVRTAGGKPVRVRVDEGRIWPLAKLDPGERVTVELTVRRPGWAGWAVGSSDTRTFSLVTPTTSLRGRWLQVEAGAPVTVAFTRPAAVVSFGGGPPTVLERPRRVVPVGVVASGAHSTGAITVAAAARSWERLPAPMRVSWFPARPFPQLLAEPNPEGDLRPDRQLTLIFSTPVADVLGKRRPTLSPATPGRWRELDDHTLAFRPGGAGFGLGTDVEVTLPVGVHLAGKDGTALTRKLGWHVPRGSTLRLQQLLAQAGYLPVDWLPAGDPPASLSAQVDAAFDPPPGQFVWRYSNTPTELTRQWQPGDWNEITRGAVMMFQADHGLDVDAIPGPVFWRTLLREAVKGTRRDDGYSYVFVHRSVPQSLNLWHNGQVILSSPGNTGVPAAPTELGTFPVFEHIPVGTMSGTNPDGSHYNDPGIRWISYFNHGDAIHAFPRASFGTPQSLGCVELPLDAAAKVWPYTPIGTLVTVED